MSYAPILYNDDTASDLSLAYRRHISRSRSRSRSPSPVRGNFGNRSRRRRAQPPFNAATTDDYSTFNSAPGTRDAHPHFSSAPRRKPPLAWDNLASNDLNPPRSATRSPYEHVLKLAKQRGGESTRGTAKKKDAVEMMFASPDVEEAVRQVMCERLQEVAAGKEALAAERAEKRRWRKKCGDERAAKEQAARHRDEILTELEEQRTRSIGVVALDEFLKVKTALDDSADRIRELSHDLQKSRQAISSHDEETELRVSTVKAEFKRMQNQWNLERDTLQTVADDLRAQKTTLLARSRPLIDRLNSATQTDEASTACRRLDHAFASLRQSEARRRGDLESDALLDFFPAVRHLFDHSARLAATVRRKAARDLEALKGHLAGSDDCNQILQGSLRRLEAHLKGVQDDTAKETANLHEVNHRLEAAGAEAQHVLSETAGKVKVLQQKCQVLSRYKAEHHRTVSENELLKEKLRAADMEAEQAKMQRDAQAAVLKAKTARVSELETEASELRQVSESKSKDLALVRWLKVLHLEVSAEAEARTGHVFDFFEGFRRICTFERNDLISSYEAHTRDRNQTELLQLVNSQRNEVSRLAVLLHDVLKGQSNATDAGNVQLTDGLEKSKTPAQFRKSGLGEDEDAEVDVNSCAKEAVVKEESGAIGKVPSGGLHAQEVQRLVRYTSDFMASAGGSACEDGEMDPGQSVSVPPANSDRVSGYYHQATGSAGFAPQKQQRRRHSSITTRDEAKPPTSDPIRSQARAKHACIAASLLATAQCVPPAKDGQELSNEQPEDQPSAGASQQAAQGFIWGRANGEPSRGLDDAGEEGANAKNTTRCARELQDPAPETAALYVLAKTDRKPPNDRRDAAGHYRATPDLECAPHTWSSLAACVAAPAVLAAAAVSTEIDAAGSRSGLPPGPAPADALGRDPGALAAFYPAPFPRASAEPQEPTENHRYARELAGPLRARDPASFDGEAQSEELPSECTQRAFVSSASAIVVSTWCLMDAAAKDSQAAHTVDAIASAEEGSGGNATQQTGDKEGDAQPRGSSAAYHASIAAAVLDLMAASASALTANRLESAGDTCQADAHERDAPDAAVEGKRHEPALVKDGAEARSEQQMNSETCKGSFTAGVVEETDGALQNRWPEQLNHRYLAYSKKL
ncbi:hypothetical protein DIPPA_22393 [Diplonema papillatum]|nr:hypothetical protein DIPPA_22393 [Diplonema papillatum]